VQFALRELPEEQRQIILLHIWGQMSFDEWLGVGIPKHGGIALSIWTIQTSAAISTPTRSSYGQGR